MAKALLLTFVASVCVISCCGAVIGQNNISSSWTDSLGLDQLFDLMGATSRGDVIESMQIILDSLPSGGIVGVLNNFVQLLLDFIHPIFNDFFNIKDANGNDPQHILGVQMIRNTLLNMMGLVL